MWLNLALVRQCSKLPRRVLLILLNFAKVTAMFVNVVNFNRFRTILAIFPSDMELHEVPGALNFVPGRGVRPRFLSVGLVN